jgi:hypothetical protein
MEIAKEIAIVLIRGSVGGQAVVDIPGQDFSQPYQDKTDFDSSLPICTLGIKQELK